MLKISQAFVLIIIALVLSSALYPIVRKFNAKMRLLPAVLLVFLAILLPFILLGVLLSITIVHQFPQIVSQINLIAHNSPLISEYLGGTSVSDYIQNYSSYLFTSTKVIATTSISIFTVIFLTFYILYEFTGLSKMFIDLFPTKYHDNIVKLLGDIAKVTGRYIRGNVIISLITGVVMYIGLLLLHIPFALPLAIFTSILDLLPMVGPIIGSLPAIILGFAISPTHGLIVILFYFMYQQIENVLIGPAIYNKALDITPAITFIAVVIGGSVFGILGAFLALPVAASIPVILEFQKKYV